MQSPSFKEIILFLEKVPAIKSGPSSGVFDNGIWWIKFQIDIEHPLAWNVVQEVGHIVNYLSIESRLPTIVYPVSPPVYLNGGPKDFLSWVIETKDIEFTPDDLKEWLEGRLPNPVNDVNEWNLDEED